MDQEAVKLRRIFAVVIEGDVIFSNFGRLFDSKTSISNCHYSANLAQLLNK